MPVQVLIRSNSTVFVHLYSDLIYIGAMHVCVYNNRVGLINGHLNAASIL